MKRRNHPQHLLGGHPPELLPHVHPAGQHRFAAQHPVAVAAADEHDRDVGAPVVPQVPPVLEALPRHPLRLVTDQHPEPFGQDVLEQLVELDRPRRRTPPTPSASNRRVPDVARGRPGPELHPAHVAGASSRSEAFTDSVLPTPASPCTHIIALASMTSARLSLVSSSASVATMCAPGQPEEMVGPRVIDIQAGIAWVSQSPALLPSISRAR